MICPKCSMNYNDNAQYCPNCGTASDANSGYQQETYQQNYEQNYQQDYDRSYQQQNYQSNQSYTMPNYGPVNYQQPSAEPTVKISQYLGWFVIGSFFGPISLIISIVFACSGTNKNRANFFRALLIIWAITFAISIVIVAVSVFLGFSFMGLTDTASLYYDFMKIGLL